METDSIKRILNEAKETVTEAAENIGTKAKELTLKVSDEAVQIIDENGNGKIDLIDFIIKALKTPGVNVNRSEYLKNAFKKYCDDEQINKSIETSPKKAGISKEIIDKAANETITMHKSSSAIASLGLGLVPGEVSVNIATTVADITQYYGQLLIVMQKLMYLYGYPELDLEKENGSIDDGTMNLIVIGLGAMAGVKEATAFLSKITSMLSTNVPKQILKTGFSTKLAYQVSKKVLKFFGIKLTKQVAEKGISNAITFVGGVLMGGITFITFSKACTNFHSAMKEMPINDIYVADVTPEFIESELSKDIQIEDDIDKE